MAVTTIANSRPIASRAAVLAHGRSDDARPTSGPTEDSEPEAAPPAVCSVLIPSPLLRGSTPLPGLTRHKITAGTVGREKAWKDEASAISRRSGSSLRLAAPLGSGHALGRPCRLRVRVDGRRTV